MHSSNTQAGSGSQSQPLKDQLKQLQTERKPLKLTLGTEMEFILAHCTFPQRTNGGFISYSELGLEVVHEILSRPMQVTCTICGELHTFNLPLNSVYDGHSAHYGKWSIVGDSSINFHNNDQTEALGADLTYFNFYQIELRSRVLHADQPHLTTPSGSNPKHHHAIDYAEEIKAVLDRLNEATISEGWPQGDRNRFSLLVNESCGMHVHIGNRNKGFPLRTVKNVLSTYIANERAIDSINAKHRIGGSTLPTAPQNRKRAAMGDDNQVSRAVYNMPWSQHHFMSVYSRRERAERNSESPEFADTWKNNRYPRSHLNIPAVRKAAYQYSASAQLTLVQNAPDLEALQSLQPTHSHQSTVELTNLKARAAVKNTVEFRQHEGSLQPVEVICWVDFLVSLVAYAHNTSDEDYANLCIGEFRSPAYHAVDLMKTIGCADQTIAHYKHRLGMQSNGFCYADELALQETVILQASAPGNLLAPLQKLFITQRQDANHPDAVRARISEKFVKGGYGQFSESYLNQIHFSGEHAAAREALTIGYVNPKTRPASPRGMTAYEQVLQKYGQPLLQSFRGDPSFPVCEQVSSPVSPTSADMVGYALNGTDIAFTIQPHIGMRSPFTGARFDEYDGNGEINQDIIGEQDDAEPSRETDRATIHPDHPRTLKAADPREGAASDSSRTTEGCTPSTHSHTQVSEERAAPRSRPRPPSIDRILVLPDRSNEPSNFVLAPPPRGRQRRRQNSGQ